jgi:hypothetical protein
VRLKVTITLKGREYSRAFFVIKNSAGDLEALECGRPMLEADRSVTVPIGPSGDTHDLTLEVEGDE